MIDTVVNVIKFRVDEKHQHFTISIDERIPDFLVGDDQRLAQVMTNLLTNAVKFTDEGGRIHFDVLLQSEKNNVYKLLVEVSDTGIGITPEQQSRLFNVFEQAEASTTRKYGGTGLGLVISKSIVEMMDGNIWVESEPAIGSTFFFTVNLAGSKETHILSVDETLSDKKTDTSISFEGRKILLVEDVEINTEIVIAMLEPLGLEIDCASNGLEAVNKFIEHPDKYEIIFMDLQMPEMDGLTATRKIRSSGLGNSSTVPIYAMTANVFKDDIDKCLEAGMNGHLGKPLDYNDILAVLTNVFK